MADTATAPLGVSALFSRTFGLFFQRLILFMMIGFVPSVILNTLGIVWMGDILAAQANGELLDPSEVFGLGYWLYLGSAMIFAFVVMGVYTLAAYDASLGKPVAIGGYVARTIAALIPIIVLGILFYLMMVIGFALLIIPGLYLMARFFVFTPAVLVEKAGFRGLSRASALSKGYRWPMVGALILLFIVVVLLSLAGQLTVGLVVAGMGGVIAWVLVQSVLSALIYSISAIFTALLYARLRELKEGVGMDQLVEVFE